MAGAGAGGAPGAGLPASPRSSLEPRPYGLQSGVLCKAVQPALALRVPSYSKPTPSPVLFAQMDETREIFEVYDI